MDVETVYNNGEVVGYIVDDREIANRNAGLVFHGGFYRDQACDGAFVWTVKDQNGGIWQRGVDYDKFTARNLALDRSAVWNEDFGGLDPKFLYKKLMEHGGPKAFYESEDYMSHMGRGD